MIGFPLCSCCSAAHQEESSRMLLMAGLSWDVVDGLIRIIVNAEGGNSKH